MIRIAADETFPEEHLTLILMRHAKSDWSDSSHSDHERPLNKRGRRDSAKMAEWLKEESDVPDAILCSTASRTRATVEIMVDIWGVEPRIVNLENLYLASQDEIMREIRSEGMDARKLMVMAHNPGISHAASTLADDSLELPTAAVAVFDLDTEFWASVTKKIDRRFRSFMRPKALSES